jgi:DNA-binding transcriptional regulator YhcF (GntR family)
MTLQVDPTGPEAPFEQVRRQIAEAATDGTFPPGHKLPTVRALATDLGLATNTVAKAYRALEVDGVVETRGRNGTFVATRHLPDGATDDAARTYALLARRRGLSKDEALRLVEGHWT